MRTVGFILFLSIHFLSMGQSVKDSTVTLSLQEVLEWASINHPIIRQAKLQDGFAEAELRKAKGYMDPKITSSYSSKELNGTQYYQKFQNTLKIPTWFPLDPKVEVYRNEGEYLNRENYVSSSAEYWQVTAGVSLPLGKGLFIDERRTLIKQARSFGEMAEADKIKFSNKVLFTITKAYWDWFLAYQEYELMEQSLEIANNLFDRVKIDFDYGEAAEIDTVQAMITLQSRKIDFQKANLELKQARLMMGVHLWGPDNVPMELSDLSIPTESQTFWVLPADSSISTLNEWASTNHPEIRKLSAKQDQLEVEQRWNRESLKPELNISYSLIDAPINRTGFETPQWDDNYKLGMDFSFPIFLRKERGNLQKTKLYIEQLDFEKYQVQQEVMASVQSLYNELITNEVLVGEYEVMAANYKRLLDAELFNLESGESDLFKLNIQQDKFIDAQVKYLQALTKYEKLKAELPYTIGLPDLSYQYLYE